MMCLEFAGVTAKRLPDRKRLLIKGFKIKKERKCCEIATNRGGGIYFGILNQSVPTTQLCFLLRQGYAQICRSHTFR
jgi:hypothetical protein